MHDISRNALENVSGIIMGFKKAAKKWGKLKPIFSASARKGKSVVPPVQQERTGITIADSKDADTPRYVPKNEGEEFEELKPEHDPDLFAAMQNGKQVTKEVAFDEYNRDYPLLIIDGKGGIRRVSRDRVPIGFLLVDLAGEKGVSQKQVLREHAPSDLWRDLAGNKRVKITKNSGYNKQSPADFNTILEWLRPALPEYTLTRISQGNSLRISNEKRYNEIVKYISEHKNFNENLHDNKAYFDVSKTNEGYSCNVINAKGTEMKGTGPITWDKADPIMRNLFRDQYIVDFDRYLDKNSGRESRSRATDGIASPEILDIFDIQIRDHTFERKTFRFVPDKSTAEQKDKGPVLGRFIDKIRKLRAKSQKSLSPATPDGGENTFPPNFDGVVTMSHDPEGNDGLGEYRVSNVKYSKALQKPDLALLTQARTDIQELADRIEYSKSLNRLMKSGRGEFSMTMDHGSITRIAPVSDKDIILKRPLSQSYSADRQTPGPSSASLPEIVWRASRESMSRSRSASKASTKERA